MPIRWVVRIERGENQREEKERMGMESTSLQVVQSFEIDSLYITPY